MLQACVVLASAPPREWLKVRVIAQDAAMPVDFLGNILGELRRAGIVDAKRGYEGGYRLARDPAEITVAELLAAIDPAGPNGNEMSWASTLPFLAALRHELETQARDRLASVSLADLAADSRANERSDVFEQA